MLLAHCRSRQKHICPAALSSFIRGSESPDGLARMLAEQTPPQICKDVRDGSDAEWLQTRFCFFTIEIDSLKNITARVQKQIGLFRRLFRCSSEANLGNLNPRSIRFSRLQKNPQEHEYSILFSVSVSVKNYLAERTYCEQSFASNNSAI
jgi:hypothetical protein